ncbi:hypothetical protein Tco_0571549 [Tanacetum coccineum]
MPLSAMTQAAIEKLVSDRVAAALAQDRATRGNTNGAGGPGGAVELCRWFEKTESVFSINECAERNKVKFDAATLPQRKVGIRGCGAAMMVMIMRVVLWWAAAEAGGVRVVVNEGKMVGRWCGGSGDGDDGGG